MTKPHTETAFSTQLVEDRTWRLREISDLRTSVSRADNISRSVLLRALVAICYAHWEGYVRFAARKYLEHVALRRLSYDQLDRQFLRNYFLPKLGSLTSKKANVSDRCAIVDEILSSSAIRFSKVNPEIVSTRSNLNFDVFSDICLVCGIDSNDYKMHGDFVDVLLLKRRNAIAHGEDTFVGIEDLEVIANTTIELMRTFGDDLENQVYLKKYRAA